jgi:hypothetical protein
LPTADEPDACIVDAEFHFMERSRLSRAAGQIRDAGPQGAGPWRAGKRGT